MNDSDGGNITNPDAIFCNLTATLEATRTHGIGITTVSPTLTSNGFSSTKIAHDKSSLAVVASILVGDIFSLNYQKLEELCT